MKLARIRPSKASATAGLVVSGIFSLGGSIATIITLFYFWPAALFLVLWTAIAGYQFYMFLGILTGREGAHFQEIAFSDSSPEPLEQRLRKLDHLREQNLITEEDYLTKKKEILSEI